MELIIGFSEQRHLENQAQNRHSINICFLSSAFFLFQEKMKFSQILTTFMLVQNAHRKTNTLPKSHTT